ncbi:MAG: DoxX family protein [Vicinamibacteria bacterium]
MILPGLAEYADWALFLLRLWIAILFGSSGWSHAKEPRERAKSVGLSPPATVALGIVEIGAAVLLVLGLWDQIAAAAIVVVMLGAIQKKAFVWKTGFWGEDSNGWYYDVLYLICALVILTTGGGSIGID